MKRLTERNKNGFAMASCCRECGYNYCCEVGGTSDCQGFDDIIDRLAAIEDILGDDYDLDHLRELVEADKAGRCVVLPWPFGNTVYEVTISCCKWRDTDNCDLYCSGYGDCWEGENVVQKTTFEPIHISKIGKTVFFTREEAEAALEKVKEARHD